MNWSWPPLRIRRPFAKSLADRYKEKGVEISSVAVHPGVINTGLTRNIGGVGALIFNWFFVNKDIPQGASTSCYALLNPQLAAEVHAGCYLADCSVTQPSDLGSDLEGKLRKNESISDRRMRIYWVKPN